MAKTGKKSKNSVLYKEDQCEICKTRSKRLLVVCSSTECPKICAVVCGECLNKSEVGWSLHKEGLRVCTGELLTDTEEKTYNVK